MSSKPAVVSLADLVDAVSSKVELPKTQVKAVVDALLDQTGDHVKNGSVVRLHGFGSFERSTRSARSGRNPKTGETITIEASHSVRFKPASSLKAAM